MTIHLVGSGARGLFDVDSTCRYEAAFRVPGSPGPEGDLTGVRVRCPRKGSIDAGDCLDCAHLRAWRLVPDVTFYCAGSDRDPVRDWMRRPLDATTVDTRCPAADELASRRGAHHLLVFDRRLTLAGVVCRCDLARGGGDSVGKVMSDDVFAVEPQTKMGVAATVMRQLKIGCLPVVSGPLVVGIVTRRDLDRAGVPRGG